MFSYQADFRGPDAPTKYFEGKDWEKLAFLFRTAVNVAIPEGTFLNFGFEFQDDDAGVPATLSLLLFETNSLPMDGNKSQEIGEAISKAVFAEFNPGIFNGSTACGRYAKSKSSILKRSENISAHEKIQHHILAKLVFGEQSDLTPMIEKYF